MTILLEQIAGKYREMFGEWPDFVVRAPGRVNLIGEHTDYNDGYVLPMAIDREVVIAGKRRGDRTVRAYSVDYQQSDTFSLDRLVRSDSISWSNYLRGIASALQGHSLRGMNLVIAGDVPRSSGLSSSAAIELAAVLAYESAGEFEIGKVERALLAQRAEREFVGVNCGIMDQFISSLGEDGHALFLDTRSLEYELIPLIGTGVEIVVSDTRKPRELVGSEYNARRAECEIATEVLARSLPGVKALRDVSPEQFGLHCAEIEQTIRRRAKHVVTENQRVLDAVVALRLGDLAGFGKIMNSSHESLRVDYEVSCPELDCLVRAAQSVEGVYGSRMTGAGFGGCTVSLVASDAVPQFIATVGSVYREAMGRKAEFYVCIPSNGAGRLR